MKQQQNEQRRQLLSAPLSALLMVLFLAFCLSSGMVGFILGRNAARSTGELVDTIVLSPGDTPLRAEAATLHFLSGELHYRNGEPCVGFTVRLANGSRTDTTDEYGKFYLSDVRSGDHTLEVTDSDGETLPSLTLSLDFSGNEEISAAGSNSFHIPESARLLELAFTVEVDRSITVETDAACVVMKDGQVVNFEGSALRVQYGSRAVTPGGNLIDANAYVAVPSEGILLSPTGSQIIMDPGMEIMPGVIPAEDGALLLLPEPEENGTASAPETAPEPTEEPEETPAPEESAAPGREDVPEGGAVLLLTGEVELPTGEIVGGEDTFLLIEGDTAEELKELPDLYEPPALEELVPGPTPEPAALNEEDPAPEEPTPEPTAIRGLSIYDGETGVSWLQESTVDLFKNRTDKNGTPIEDPKKRIMAPGSQGYYDFCLENPESFDIAYTVTIRETTFHLPILYSVVDRADNRNYLHRERTGENQEALVSPRIVIPAESTQEFRIEWAWQYEDWYNYRHDDKLDTAGANDKRGYQVALLVNAEQILRDPEPDEDEDTVIKYPGVH